MGARMPGTGIADTGHDQANLDEVVQILLHEKPDVVALQEGRRHVTLER